MKLEDIITQAKRVPLALIGADRALTKEVQIRLAEIGLVDPPADGSFGPVSQWGLGEFLRKIGSRADVIDAEVARALLGQDAASLYPVNDTDTFAGRIVRAIQERGHWLARHPDCVNIVYIEGVDPDGTPNDDAPNIFNDLRLVLRINRAGNPDIVDAWEGTTEPGRYYVQIEPLDPRGAARIAFDQFKAWSVGTHLAGKPQAHEALVQVAPIRVHRDLNRDFERTGDQVFTGLFGVNQHWGFDMAKNDIGKASAGCLLGRTKAGHRAFMSIVKADPRPVRNGGYRFMTTVLPAESVVPQN